MDEIKTILKTGTNEEKKALFLFDESNTNEEILFKFNLWARYFFSNYFTSEDASFHSKIDEYNLRCYREQFTFVDIAFRGAAKTARTKLFIAYCISNDLEHTRRYFKVLSEDRTNAQQITTDIYNMFINPKVARLYPELFEKTAMKREERMSSFTTSTGIKVLSDTVGTEQRGAIQEDARPDFIWFEDFENRKTLRSAVTTQSIWDNMEEARTSLAKGGSAVYTCNYISEAGNVHKLVGKYQHSERAEVLIVPILKNGKSTWSVRYSLEDIEQMREDDDDFEGERLCEPSSSADVFFDRASLEKMPILTPVKEVNGFKMYREYQPGQRYASGHDIAGGVGLDSSTSAFIAFDLEPAQVVATYRNNRIRPDVFGDEIERQSNYYQHPIVAIERNNHGHTTIARARQIGLKLYATKSKDTKIDPTNPTEWGWHTNTATKPKMLYALAKAVEQGLIHLNDPDLIQECKSYTRNDLMDDIKDPRLATRHFDMIIACAIAWQMKDHTINTSREQYRPNFKNRI